MHQRFAKLLLAATVFLGATLLFMVQPLVAKSILPWFGGSAAVWTTAVLLYQTLLLGGYLYAHISADLLPRRAQVAVHILLLLGALAVLPVIPPESLKPIDGASAVWRVLLVLLVTAGAPFFILSSTSTLAQAWWNRIDPHSPPYRLYALSNAGSLLGLLTYPAIVEPLLGSRAQAFAWSAGMCLFALLSGACAVMAGRREVIRSSASAATPAGRAVIWLFWPALSSALLLALTASLAQRVAPIPFLWILPLSVYLLSFIICFERPAWYRRSLFIPAYMLLLIAASLLMVMAVRLAIWQQLALTCALLFSGCIICHGELYRSRPPSAKLTLYYLAIALGSVIGSALVAIAAPLAFPAQWELHLALTGVTIGAVLVMWFARDSRLRAGRPAWAWFSVGLWASMTGLLLWMDASGGFGLSVLVDRARSFHGQITVREGYRPEIDAIVRTLYHDGVVHGLQATDAQRQSEPLSYYWPGSGLGKLMLATESPAGRKIGVVGLGAGAITAWARSVDELIFYELDPLMIHIAKTDFTYLANAEGPIQIIPGDARLALQAQPDQNFDLLILDAFSGNALPVHLLTIEAIEAYRRHLKPDGVLAIHISNHYLDLEPVIARMAEATGLHAAILSTGPGVPADLRCETDVAILAASSRLLEHDLIREVAHRPRARPGLRLWTDDYSNLLRVVK